MKQLINVGACVMKALATVLLLFLLAFPVAADEIEIPALGVWSQLRELVTSVWEGLEEIAPAILSSGSKTDETEQTAVEPDPPTQEIGPMIDPIGDD